jgi:serine/threonine-protein kinase
MASEYRLTGKLEGGELAELYRAEKAGAGPVVVKLFHPKTTHTTYAREVAETQNRLLKLSNPGIAQVVDIGIVKNRLAIVREDKGRYTLGLALQRLNTKEVVISPALVMAVVLDLLDAITEAHGVQVLHGALTPGNVMLSSAGRAAICDFGALSALNAVPALKKSFAGRGRTSYRAPELATKGEITTAQSDIYSLGAIMYELLTLKEPSVGSVSTRREQLPPPSRLDRRLNSRIDPLVLRALDPVPGRRYKNTSEFASAVRTLLADSGGLPDREAIARFTTQLFPNDVHLGLGPVAFDGSFTLTSVEGAELEDFEGSLLVPDRPSFSGTLDEMPMIPPDEKPTVAEMPAIAEAPTELEKPITKERSTNWHAPAAAMPPSARSGGKEAVNPDILKRVKHIEDFAMVGRGIDTDPHAPTVTPSDDIQTVLRPRGSVVGPPTPIDTVRPATTASDSQSIDEDVIMGPNGKPRRVLAEERDVERFYTGTKKWLSLVAGSLLLAAVFMGIALWRSGATLPDDTEPFVPQKSRAPTPIKHSATHSDSAPRPPPTKNCYAPPKKAMGMGFVSVAADRPIWVRIDGDYVCGSHLKIPAVTGSRSIAAVDTRTGEEYVNIVKVEPNMTTPVVPEFFGRR